MLVQQISSQEAFNILKSDLNSILIDVRTIEEFNLVGTIDASSFNNRMILLPWQFYHNGELNPDFFTDLQGNLNKFFNNNAIDIKLIFICRSSARSNYASNFIANYGYKNCFNINDGFEGAIDFNNHRCKINGWKYNNLPWRQK